MFDVICLTFSSVQMSNIGQLSSVIIRFECLMLFVLLTHQYKCQISDNLLCPTCLTCPRVYIECTADYTNKNIITEVCELIV